MNFLRTLFWVVVAVSLAIFSNRNWGDVTLNLWGDIQADIKIPLLLLIMFLIGFLPPWLMLRARIWGLNRRIEGMERNRPVPAGDGETIAEQRVEPTP